MRIGIHTRAVVSTRTLALGVGSGRVNGSSSQSGAEEDGEEGLGLHDCRGY